MKHAPITFIATLGILGAPHAAQSQEKFPNRPIRMVVGFSAGSQVDVIARMMARKMNESWGQPVTVDNRPGAGSTLANANVAKAAPNGHTLVFNSVSHAINATLYTTLPFDTLRDFAGVSQISSVPLVLAIAPAQGIKSVKELIALAKAKPGQLNYASAGIGSGSHINAEMFNLAAGINVAHIPYKGGVEPLTDTMTGRTLYFFSPLGSTLPFIKDKRLLPLSVSTAKRAPLLPDVPTLAEAALPGFEYDHWYGLLAPVKTPRPILAQLSHEVARILDLPDIREQLASQGVIPKPSTPEEFDKFVRAEVEKLGRVIKAARLKVE